MRFFSIRPIHIKYLQTCCIVLTALVLNACAIYKPDVTQGNIVTTEQTAELKQGMSRQQVAQILGSPLLQDVFNSNRWDYVYRFLKANSALEQRVFTVFFDAAGKLDRWSGLIAPEQKNITAMSEITVPITVNETGDAPKPLAEWPAGTVAPEPLAASVAVQAPAQAPAGAPARAPALAPATASPNVSPNVSPLLSPDINVVIGNKLAAWRAAWMAKDLASYSAHYAPGYKGDLVTPAALQAQRKRFFDAAGDISITLSNIKVIQTSPTDARASFFQHYQSARYTDKGTKNLFFQRTGDEWHIVAERFIKLS